MRAILMFHNCEGQSHKSVSTDNNFRRERRAEAGSNQGPSAYQPNALPLGQTGSLAGGVSRRSKASVAGAKRGVSEWLEPITAADGSVADWPALLRA